MNCPIRSIRTFIGAKDLDVSRSFYRRFGFDEQMVADNLCLVSKDDVAFYLSQSGVGDWINNTELLFVVDDVQLCFKQIEELKLKQDFPTVKIVPVKPKPWGQACYLLDPAGIALCFAQFG